MQTREHNREYSLGTFFCLLCFSQTSQTSKTYSFGHLSAKRQISKASKPSASKAGRFRRLRRNSKHVLRNNKSCPYLTSNNIVSCTFILFVSFSEYVFFWIRVFEGFDVCKFQKSESFKVPKGYAPDSVEGRLGAPGNRRT